MSELKIVVKTVPMGACPCCGHNQFVVSEVQHNNYLTNRDGEIIDSKEIAYSAAGCCVNCGKVFPMQPTNLGFIPMTPLRTFLSDYMDSIHNKEVINYKCKNPMFKEVDNNESKV